MKVFISHSTRDLEFASNLARSLKKLGVNVWLDRREIGAGDAWAKDLRAGIRESDSFVQIVGSENAEHTGMLFELGAALASAKPIVAVVSKDYDRSRLPELYKGIQTVPRASAEKTAQALVNAARSQKTRKAGESPPVNIEKRTSVVTSPSRQSKAKLKRTKVTIKS